MKKMFPYVLATFAGVAGCAYSQKCGKIDARILPCPNMMLLTNLEHTTYRSLDAVKEIHTDLLLWVGNHGTRKIEICKYANDISFVDFALEFKNKSGRSIRCGMKRPEHLRPIPDWFESVRLKQDESICVPTAYDVRLWECSFPEGLQKGRDWDVRLLVCGNDAIEDTSSRTQKWGRLGASEWAESCTPSTNVRRSSLRAEEVTVSLAYNPFWKSSVFTSDTTKRASGFEPGGEHLSGLGIYAFALIENNTAKPFVLEWTRGEPWRCFASVEAVDRTGRAQMFPCEPIDANSKLETKELAPSELIVVPIPLSSSVWPGLSHSIVTDEAKKIRVVLADGDSISHSRVSAAMRTSTNGNMSLASNWLNVEGKWNRCSPEDMCCNGSVEEVAVELDNAE